MKIFVTGATGLLGRHLTAALIQRGDSVVALTRTPRAPRKGVQYIGGHAGDLAPWRDALSVCDAVVNLAGESILGRWTAAKRRAILASRCDITQALYEAMAALPRRPTVLINASAVGFYGTDAGKLFDEGAPNGQGFLAEVCKAWEDAAQQSEALGLRCVRFRFGMLLARDGGGLPPMLLAMKAMLGGPLGSGSQWLPWLHVDDAVGLILHALKHADLHGPVNAVAPEAVTNQQFMAALGKALHRPSWLPTPGLAMKLIMGQMADEMLLQGQHVVCARALTGGYHFKYPTLENALVAATRAP